jgi:hypothetical protein
MMEARVLRSTSRGERFKTKHERLQSLACFSTDCRPLRFQSSFENSAHQDLKLRSKTFSRFHRNAAMNWHAHCHVYEQDGARLRRGLRNKTKGL